MANGCSTYHECGGTYNCDTYGTCETIETDYKKGFSHNINTNYSITVAGCSIPIVKTVRTFSANWHTAREAPFITDGMHYFGSWTGFRCETHAPDQHNCAVKENCTIEKSTLHYIDHRYKVCLYRKQTEKLTISSSQKNNEVALFRTQSGPFHRVRVMTGDFTQTRKIQWILIKDGEETVIDALEESPSFIGGAYASTPLSGSSQWFPDYTRPAGIHQVLIFPAPGSMGIAQSDLECGTPFYDYSTPDGMDQPPASTDGGKDFFYPEWCRNMQEDPIWKEIAGRRWAAKWYHATERNNELWLPPPLTVDPMPRGTYVKHPKVGEAYQWLTNISGRDVVGKITTSPDMNDIIQLALPTGVSLLSENGAEPKDVLYYPIGVA